MVELFSLVALFVVFGLIAGLVMMVGLALKLVFWLVFLPIRLAFKLLFLPFTLLKWTFKGLGLLFALPLMLIAVVVGGLAIVAALIVPLLPLVFLAFVVWALFRLFRRPAVA